MYEALLELREELRRSERRLEERLAELSESSSPEEKKRKKGVRSSLNKTKKQLEQLTSLLSAHTDTESATNEPNLSSSLNQIPPNLVEKETQSVGSITDVVDSCHDVKTKLGSAGGIISSIVILVAMEQEARPFLERHGLVENVPSPFAKGSPMLSYSGRVATESGDEVMVHLIWNGRCKIHSCNLVATTAAGVATYAALQYFQPDLVISAGTAGGFSELGACIGDVYLSTKCIFHARRIPLCLPGEQGNSNYFKEKHFEEYGFGHFRSPPLYHLAKRIGVKQGIVSSSDCLDCSEIDLQLLRSEGAVVKEMEAAAVAWVCQVLGSPFFAVKSITDIVDGSIDSEEEFYSNLARASDSLQEKLTLVVTHLGGNSLQTGNSARGISLVTPTPSNAKKQQVQESSGRDPNYLAAQPSPSTLFPEERVTLRMTVLLVAVGVCTSYYLTFMKSKT